MTINSSAQLVRQIEKFDLLEKANLNELTRNLVPRHAHVRTLAQAIRERGWLTSYQLNKLCLGNGSRLIFGSYVVLDRLGEGGMGKVYKARHRLLNRLVALKVIRKDQLESAEAINRFFREIRVAAKLDHPNIVLAYDAGEVEGRHYYAMEYVHGTDLARVLRESGPLPIKRACELIRQTALGLQHAANAGLVHRDIKPSNLLLISRKKVLSQKNPGFPEGDHSLKGDQVKILDMGLVRSESLAHSAQDPASLTLVQTVLGTPDYIAPEQARNPRSADIRSDLYSLGCTFYHLLTGHVPFPGDLPMEKLIKHWIEHPIPVLQLRPDTPVKVAALIDKLMAKNPDERFQTPLEVVKEIEGLETSATSAFAHSMTETDETIALGNHQVPRSSADTHCEKSTGELTMGEEPESSYLSSRYLQQDREKRKWLWFTMIGAAFLVCLLAALGVLLVQSLFPGKPIVATMPLRGRAESAEAAFQKLIALQEDATVVPEDKRLALLNFRTQFHGTAPSIQAAEYLAQLPSPLDRLNNAALLPTDRAPWQPPELVAVLGEQRWRHWTAISASAINPTGSLVASCGSDSVITLRQVPSGMVQALLNGPGSSCSALAFSVDGGTLASAGQNGLVVFWDIKTAKERARFQAHTGRISAMAYSRDGKTLATAGDERLVKLWEAETAKPRLILPTSAGPIVSLAFSSDSTKVATAGPSDVIRIWDSSTGKPLQTLPNTLAKVQSAAFSPDGLTLAVALESAVIKVWDLAGNKEKHSFAGLGPVAFSSDGKLVVCLEADGVLPNYFDLKANAPRAAVPTMRRGRILTLSLSHDGKLFTTGDDQGEVREWETSSGKELAGPAERWTSRSYLEFAPDCRALLAGTSNLAGKSWDAKTGKEIPLLGGQARPPRALAVSPDGQVIAIGGDDMLVRFCDAKKGTDLVLPIKRHNGPLFCLAYSPNGQMLASGGADGNVVLWDVAAGKERHLFKANADAVQTLAFSPDAKTLATSGKNKSIRLWDVSDLPRRIGTLDGHQGVVTALAFAEDGQSLLSASEDKSVRMWDPHSMHLRTIVHEIHTAAVRFMALTADGKRLITTGPDGRIVVWDFQAGKAIHTWSMPGPALGLSVATDNRHIAVAAGNGSVYIFRLNSIPKKMGA